MLKRIIFRPGYLNPSIWSGFLLGIGFVAFVDETVFHQLLHWHHFYDKSTNAIGLISDGLFHVFSWFATIGGLFIFAHIRRTNAFRPSIWWGGVLLGVGAFQLYDGTVQHKLMRIHQIRYVENVVLYDLVWNVLAFLILIAGLIIITRHNENEEQIKMDVHNEP